VKAPKTSSMENASGAFRLFKFCYDCLVSGGVLSHLHAYLRAEWQIDVNSGSEFYKSQMLVDVAVFFRLGVGNDAPCHGSGNLPAQNLRAAVGNEHHVGMLVFFACLRQPCLVEIAVLMMNELHLAVNGEPVGVYIEKAHEDTHHNPLVVEVCVFLNLFDYNHLAVGWSDHDIFRVSVEESLRTAEEIDYYSIYDAKNEEKAPERNLVVERHPQYCCYGSDEYDAVEQGVGALSMYSDIFKFLYSFTHSINTCENRFNIKRLQRYFFYLISTNFTLILLSFQL